MPIRTINEYVVKRTRKGRRKAELTCRCDACPFASGRIGPAVHGFPLLRTRSALYGHPDYEGRCPECDRWEGCRHRLRSLAGWPSALTIHQSTRGGSDIPAPFPFPERSNPMSRKLKPSRQDHGSRRRHSVSVELLRSRDCPVRNLRPFERCRKAKRPVQRLIWYGLPLSTSLNSLPSWPASSDLECAQRLLADTDGLTGLAASPPIGLMEIKGVGATKAAQLKAGFRVG